MTRVEVYDAVYGRVRLPRSEIGFSCRADVKAVAGAGTVYGPTVAAKMREMPVNDCMTSNGKIREDGRLVRDMYLFKVKSPEESKYKFDYYQLLATNTRQRGLQASGGRRMSSAKQGIAAKAPSRSGGSEGREAVERIIKGRFANRSFTSWAVPTQMIDDILDVAQFAPSGDANIQLGMYMSSRVRRRKKYRARYGRPIKRPGTNIRPSTSITRRRCRSRMRRAAISSDVCSMDRSGSSNRTGGRAGRPRKCGFFGAPVGLIITIDRRLQVGSWLDLGMFIQNVMIAAGARGLQACPQETFSKYHMCSGNVADTSRGNNRVRDVDRIRGGRVRERQEA